MNAVAGAYAECSPVVVISGAPGVVEQRDDPLIHHRFGPFDFQRQIFERITCATAVLDDCYTAARQIDRALESMTRMSQPVYIELPRDQVLMPVYPVLAEASVWLNGSDADSLREAVEEAVVLLGKARRPMVLAGVELQRRGLQDALVSLVEHAGFRVAATLTGKSVMAEHHPAYLGIYEGAMGIESTRIAVEEADALLMLGVTLNDVDTGINSARLDPNVVIRAAGGEVVIRHHRYAKVNAGDFLKALEARLPVSGSGAARLVEPAVDDFPVSERPMTVERLITRLNRVLSPEFMVVSDIGDCLFSAIDLRVHERSGFFSAAYYTTMGFGVPAALGVHFAHPDRRLLVLVGDGAFQMTGTELSSFARFGIPAIVVVFNNGGYSTERALLDGPFNDIASWRFDRLGEVMGPLSGFEVFTEDDFERAVGEALSIADRPCIINVHLQPDDASPALRRLGKYLGSKV